MQRDNNNERFVAVLQTENEMLHLAAQIARAISDESGAVIYLYGQLGAGKTTFTRGFLYGLGLSGKVKSPTYTLVEPYDIAEKKIFHFDLYRLTNPDELTHIGMEDYFLPEGICLIEWPEKGEGKLPKADLSCQIDILQQGRQITITPLTSRGKDVIRQLS